MTSSINTIKCYIKITKVLLKNSIIKGYLL
jgi:hypothetical protein